MKRVDAEHPNEVGAKRFKEARLAAGLSQKQLDLDVGPDDFVASTRINRCELGVHRADYPMEVKLAKALGVPAGYFYAETDDLAKSSIAFHRAPKAARKLAMVALAGDVAGWAHRHHPNLATSASGCRCVQRTQHRQALVAGDAGHLQRMKSLLQEPRRRLMPKVVPSEILDAEVFQRSPPDASQSVGGGRQDGPAGLNWK
jgi:transcriptional regulator with XRE-family HTH domain